MNTETEVRPEVGMGATLYCYSDRQAFTVIEVKENGRKLVLQRDRAILLNGHGSGEPDALQFSPGGFAGHTSGTQRYRYERNPDGERLVVTRRKRPNAEGYIYKHVGTPTKQRGGTVVLGKRSEYYDFNF